MDIKANVIALLGDAKYQDADICYAIALIRQFEYHLKVTGALAPDEELSIQELVNLIPRDCLEKDCRGGIRNIFAAVSTLCEFGTVLVDDCPFSQLIHLTCRKAVLGDRYYPFDVEVHSRQSFEDSHPLFGDISFDLALRESLLEGPVAVRFDIFPSFSKLEGTDVYDPSLREIERFLVEYDGYGHYVLAVSSRVVNGLNVLECQDSYGQDRGVDGFIMVALRVVDGFLKVLL